MTSGSTDFIIISNVNIPFDLFYDYLQFRASLVTLVFSSSELCPSKDDQKHKIQVFFDVVLNIFAFFFWLHNSWRVRLPPIDTVFMRVDCSNTYIIFSVRDAKNAKSVRTSGHK